MGRRKGITKLTALKRRLREGFDKRSADYIKFINQSIDEATSTTVVVELEIDESDQAQLGELLVGAGFDVMFMPDGKIELSEPVSQELVEVPYFVEPAKTADPEPTVDGCTDATSEFPSGDVALEVEAPF